MHSIVITTLLLSTCLKCTNCTNTLDLVTRKLNYVACEQQRYRTAHLYSLIHTFIVSSMDRKIAKKVFECDKDQLYLGIVGLINITKE